MSENRSRTLTWEDPMIGANAARTLSGKDYMTAMMNGDVPPSPIAITMNLIATEVEEGRIVFQATPDESFYNPIGTIHGGFTATVLDSALGCAVHTTLPAGVGYTTSQLNINYLRAITLDTGVMTCEGVVIHSGRRVATAEAKLTDAGGKLYAHATTTCLILG